jgi:acyl-coenzyme A synthetase/AMP-(fatty) acid ligase
VAFVSSQFGVEDPELLSQIKSRLPSYMVPSRIHRIDSLPLNANGKVNRHQLVSLLQEGRL